MDHRWSQEWRNRNDAHARQLWLDMEQRVWRDARIFSGLEPLPPTTDSSDDLDMLTEAEVADIGELGDVGGLPRLCPVGRSPWQGRHPGADLHVRNAHGRAHRPR